MNLGKEFKKIKLYFFKKIFYYFIFKKIDYILQPI